MPTKLGYLLPTREHIMEDRHDSASLLALADRADGLGYDSIWAGDSLLARPRQEPLTLLAAVAGRIERPELGTAVLLPAMRNPVLLAHQAATLDQVSEGRLILGVGIATDAPSVRAEFAAAGVPFEKRVGRMLEGLRLCRALWTGDAVDWEGRWPVQGGVLAPKPHRTGGPPIWGGGTVEGAIRRAALNFDGWFPTGPDAEGYGETLTTVRSIATEAGRNRDAVTGAAYLTIAIDENPANGEDRINRYLEGYYNVPAERIRERQACFAGPAAAAVEWLAGYVAQGASHIVLRFVGDHEHQMETIAKLRGSLG